MNKNKLFALLLAALLVLLACDITYEGIVFSDDEQVSADQTATAFMGEAEQLLNPGSAAETPEPEYRPSGSVSMDSESKNAGTHEYSTQATNFGCVCQVDGNVTVNFNFVGNQLEFTNPGGGVDVYEKVETGKFKRTFMGYYILTSGSGAQATDTVVEEERHVVIILTDSGYIMEHYQGDASSPCCYHTFTQVK